MKKRLFLLMMSLITLATFSQNTNPFLSPMYSPTNGEWNKGTLQVDGDFVLPTTLNSFTNSNLRDYGKLMYDTTDSITKFHNGTEWKGLAYDLQTATNGGNTTDNNIGIGVSAPPLAHLHVGDKNSTRSSNPHILIAETIDDASGSGNSHGFADSSTFNRSGTVSYAAFDGRFTLTGEAFNHIVSFQHNPLVDISGTVGDVYGLYTSTSLEAGTITNNFGVYAADAVVTGGAITNNYGLYVPALSSGTNNYGVYVENVQSFFKGDVNLWRQAGDVGSGATLRFKSGASSASISEAIISHEIISSSRANLVFKVRTASTAGDAGLTEVARIDGGTVKTFAVTGKITASVAPTAATDVVRKTELDLKANIASPVFTGDPQSVTPATTDNDTSIQTTAGVKNKLDTYTGWGQYSDGVYTVGSPLVINSGVTSTLTNNASTSITTQLPTGVTNFWNNSTNKITPQNDGDFYMVNVRFTASSSVLDGFIEVGLDIGAPMNLVTSQGLSLRKGAGNPQVCNIAFPVYSGSTFVANGGEIKVTSVTGNTSIYNIVVVVNRVHKAK